MLQPIPTNRRGPALFLATLAAACDGCSRSAAQEAHVALAPEPTSVVGAGTSDTSHSGRIGPGPPWGHAWCITSDAVWSEQMTRKYAADMVRKGRDVHTCPNGARFEGKDGRGFSVWVRCGDAEVGAVPWYETAYWPKRAFDGELGVDAYTFVQPTLAYEIHAWDKDVPCYVNVSADGPDGVENERRARELTKGVLARLSPEQLARPLAELVVGAESKTPERAQAELARYEDKATTVQRYAPLASGYPKVIKSADFPGLPPGKFFLLFAVCGSTKGEQLAVALSGAVPNPVSRAKDDFSLQSYRIDGLGLPDACPANVTADPNRLGTDWGSYILDGDRQLQLGMISSRDVTTPGATHSRLAAFLYDRDLKLLDSTVVEFAVPQSRDDHGRYASQSHVSYDGCKGVVNHDTPMLHFGCDANWADLECRVKPVAGTTYDLEATADGKIKTTSRKWETEGEGCRPNERENEDE